VIFSKFATEKPFPQKADTFVHIDESIPAETFSLQNNCIFASFLLPIRFNLQLFSPSAY